MRVVVLFLAILLLPLRGGWGDGMNPTMTLAAMQATAPLHTMSADAHALHDMADMTRAGHGGHEEHGGHEGHDGHAMHEAQPASTDCQTVCGDCQLCHSVALTWWPEAAAPLDAPRAAPAFLPAPFASAEPAPGFKPPIS